MATGSARKSERVCGRNLEIGSGFEFLDRISYEEASAAELRVSVPGRPLHSLFAVADASTGTPTPEKPPGTAAMPIGAGGAAASPTAETLAAQETLYGITGTSTLGCSSPTLGTLGALRIVADQGQSRDLTWV